MRKTRKCSLVLKRTHKTLIICEPQLNYTLTFGINFIYLFSLHRFLDKNLTFGIINLLICSHLIDFFVTLQKNLYSFIK